MGKRTLLKSDALQASQDLGIRFGRALATLNYREQQVFSEIKEQLITLALKNVLNNFRELLDTTPDLVAYLNSPVASPSAKKEIIKKVITPQVSKETSQFLMILTDRNRISYLQGIATAYLELVYELANIKIVEVSSASKLTDQQQDLLIEKLETMTNAREVKLVVTVDSTLLGGFLIKTI